jgi:hypothetical protein
MHGLYERDEVDQDGQPRVLRVQLLANPEDIARYQAKGYRLVGHVGEPATEAQRALWVPLPAGAAAGQATDEVAG